MSKLTLVVNNSVKHPNPKGPVGAGALKPVIITQAIGLQAA